MLVQTAHDWLNSRAPFVWRTIKFKQFLINTYQNFSEPSLQFIRIGHRLFSSDAAANVVCLRGSSFRRRRLTFPTKCTTHCFHKRCTTHKNYISLHTIPHNSNRFLAFHYAKTSLNHHVFANHHSTQHTQTHRQLQMLTCDSMPPNADVKLRLL